MKLPKAYEPDNYEPQIYALWETSGAFAPMDEEQRKESKAAGKGEPYSIVMPPPNANADLHVGHSLEIIKDILIRYQRMNGRDTIYIPGADHAGFETWVVFEKALEKEGKTRFDFSREQLYKMTWDFVEQNRGKMELQIRALGVSCDWSRTVFTLDEKVVNIVYDTFKKLWDDGLIYRGERLVNYCTKHQTSFADIEVAFKEEKGHLWQIAYPLVDGNGEIIVATTRPETMLGDVAIAVHPDDERYRKLVGKTVKLPLTEREIPIIADEGVELGFGTGAVKITPAHDPLDFEIGQRHNLGTIQVIGFDGKMTNNAPEKYRDLTVLEARKEVLNDLEKQDFLRKTENYTHQVPHCYKCGTVIEPMLMKQWFVKVQPLAQRAKKVVESGEIKFTPAQKADELIRYYDEMRDWNISRQIPWGIPIPAFQNAEDEDDWIFDTRVDQTEIIVEGKTYRRDDDTFDTWFSSGQWPYVVTDYLNGGELARFYPTSLMENGVDIMRPWDSRMIMLGLYRTDKVPFKEIYLHGMVTDEHGVKMSKSKGNVINPMGIVAEFGSDALRLGIVMNRSAGQPQAFSPASVIAGRNFCNKLWNIARFIEEKIGDSPVAENIRPETLAEHWILRQLNNAQKAIDDNIANYRFAEAVETIYHFIWDDVADWFIESAKVDARPEFLRAVLDICLKITHPFAPFVTETIWTAAHDDDQTLLISEMWPPKFDFSEDQAAEFDKIRALVSEIRYVVTELPANKKYDLIYKNDALIAENADLIKSLAHLKSIEPIDTPRGLRIATPGRTAWLDLSSDLVYEHQTRLESRLVETRAEIEKLEQRLANKNYTEKAPTNLVEETRSQLQEKQDHEKRLVAELDVIKK